MFSQNLKAVSCMQLIIYMHSALTLTLLIGASFMNANGHNPYKTYLGGIAGTNELLNGHDENELGNLKHW